MEKIEKSSKRSQGIDFSCIKSDHTTTFSPRISQSFGRYLTLLAIA